MSMVQTEWWCLELPDEWSAEMEDDCVTISDCDGVSEIDITVVRKDGGDVDESDLKQFAEDLIADGLQGEAVSAGMASGLLFAYDDDDGAWREWYLGCHSLLIYITYNTPAEHKGLDDAMVDDIISTLVVLEEGDLDSDLDSDSDVDDDADGDDEDSE